MLSVAEPASCDDTPLPTGDRNAPVRPEYYSVLPKHDEEPQLSGTVIQPDSLPGKLSVAVCSQHVKNDTHNTNECTQFI
jgi:hypothetical protein